MTMDRKSRSTDLVPDEDLELNSKICSAYEIDDTEFDLETVPADVIDKINKHNDWFERNVLLPTIIKTIRNNPCTCDWQGPRIRRRFKAHKWFNRGIGTGLISQDDLESYQWRVIIKALNGEDQETLVLIRECKHCGKIEMFGDSDIIHTEITKLYMNNVDKVSSSEYVVEDMETGEVLPADDVLKALQGEVG